MDSDTMSFAVPFAGLVLGMIVMVVGIFQSGLNPITYAGIGIGFLSIVAMTWAGFKVHAEGAQGEAH